MLLHVPRGYVLRIRVRWYHGKVVRTLDLSMCGLSVSTEYVYPSSSLLVHNITVLPPTDIRMHQELGYCVRTEVYSDQIASGWLQDSLRVA